MESWIAYGSLMYVLGLFSCGILVWILTNVTRDFPTGRHRIHDLQKEFENMHTKERLRDITHMAIERYCGVS